MKPHFIKAEPDDEDGRELELAYVTPAERADVDFVLQQDTDGHDGRSEWVWIRLREGTLALATFPQGDTYTAISDPGKAPFGDR